MESTKHVQGSDDFSAKLKKDGDRVYLDPFTSDGEARLKQLAEKRESVRVEPISFAQASH